MRLLADSEEGVRECHVLYPPGGRRLGDSPVRLRVNQRRNWLLTGVGKLESSLGSACSLSGDEFASDCAHRQSFSLKIGRPLHARHGRRYSAPNRSWEGRVHAPTLPRLRASSLNGPTRSTRSPTSCDPALRRGCRETARWFRRPSQTFLHLKFQLLTLETQVYPLAAQRAPGYTLPSAIPK